VSLKKIASLLGLENIVDPETITQGIKKSSPFLSKFINKSVAQGFGTGAIISFLSDLNKKGRLDERIPPSVAASEKRSEQERAPERALTSAVAATPFGLMMGDNRDLAKQEPQQASQTIDVEPLQQQSVSQEAQAQEELGTERQAATALGEITSLEDLARIDQAVAQKVGEGLQRGLTAHDIDASLKRSRILGPRAMMVERKLGKPIAWIIDYISNRPQEDRQQGTIGQTDNLIQSALDLLGR